MKLPESMFWELTPRELQAIADQFWEWEDVWNRRFGTVAAAAWNAMRFDKKQRRSWSDWKDWLNPFSRKNRSRGLTREQIMKNVADMRKLYYSWKQ